MKEIQGSHLHSAIVSGACTLIENRDFLNQINMFPVADQDTGSNLAHTLQAVAEKAEPSDSVSETMDNVAQAALMGARGNSGAIFAQFFQGLSEHMKEVQKISVSGFCSAVCHAVKSAYGALQNPVEGTVLTAMKEWSRALNDLRFLNSFGELLKRSLVSLEKAVANTRGVQNDGRYADAGAQGFLFFLRGFVNGIYNTDSVRLRRWLNSLERTAPMLENADFHDTTEPPAHRYCTEFLVSRVNTSLDDLRQMLSRRGDSVIVAGSRKKARIHIHTNNPALVARKLKTVCSLSEQKSDDMLRQYQNAHKSRGGVALVVDSVCDVAPAFAEKHHVHIIPLLINTQETAYLDKRTLVFSGLHDLVRSDGVLPSSSQPSPMQLQLFYEELMKHYDSVISLHVSSEISGTYQAAVLAAGKVSPRISVVDTRTLSGGIATYLRRAARAVEEGKNHEEILESLKVNPASQSFYLSVETLEYLKMSGRITGVKKFIMDMSGIQPVFQAKDGKLGLFALTRNEDVACQKILETIKQSMKTPPLDCSWRAVWRRAAMRKKRLSFDICGLEVFYHWIVFDIQGF